MLEVSAAIIRKDDRVLIAQRGRDKSLGLKWEFPGGKIESNETPEESLIREIKEELNIDIEIEEFFAENIHEYQSGKIKLIAFLARWKSGDIKLAEHEQIKWVKVDELNAYDFATADLPFVEKLGGIV